MKIDILASGSSGNCIAIRTEQTTLLIDAGIAKTKIEKRLLEVGIRADQIAAALITHAHNDHVKGLPLVNKYRIPVYASDGEWKGISGVDDELRRTLETTHSKYDMVEFGDVHVYPFKVHHDAYEPLGYSVEDDIGNRCCVVLDTGHVDREMLEMMEGNIYIIESNHDQAMVEASDYPLSVQSRILSDIGHLSNDQTAAALKRLIRGMGERIYLTHLSSNNNMPELARLTVESALRAKGFKNGKHYYLEVV